MKLQKDYLEGAAVTGIDVTDERAILANLNAIARGEVRVTAATPKVRPEASSIASAPRAAMTEAEYQSYLQSLEG
jgi:hypothetical protein